MPKRVVKGAPRALRGARKNIKYGAKNVKKAGRAVGQTAARAITEPFWREASFRKQGVQPYIDAYKKMKR